MQGILSRMIKNVSADRFLSFAFGKLSLYNKHREHKFVVCLWSFSK